MNISLPGHVYVGVIAGDESESKISYPSWAKEFAQELADSLDPNKVILVYAFFSTTDEPSGVLGTLLDEWKKKGGESKNVALDLSLENLEKIGINANLDDFSVLSTANLSLATDMYIVLPGSVRALAQLSSITTFTLYPLQKGEAFEKKIFIYDSHGFWKAYFHMIRDMTFYDLLPGQVQFYEGEENAKDSDQNRFLLYFWSDKILLEKMHMEIESIWKIRSKERENSNFGY